MSAASLHSGFAIRGILKQSSDCNFVPQRCQWQTIACWMKSVFLGSGFSMVIQVSPWSCPHWPSILHVQSAFIKQGCVLILCFSVSVLWPALCLLCTLRLPKSYPLFRCLIEMLVPPWSFLWSPCFLWPLPKEVFFPSELFFLLLLRKAALPYELLTALSLWHSIIFIPY